MNGEPCVIEHKTIVCLNPDRYNAGLTKTVEVGDEDYYERVPYQFRKQLLTQVAVLGFKYSLLVIGGPSGPHSTTLIRYSQEVIEEFLSLLRHDCISTPYRWFIENANRDISDKQFMEKVPSQAEARVRELIQSNLPLMRAVYCYQLELKRAIDATKLFRFGVVNIYDLGKAPADTFCKMVAEVMSGETLALQWRQLISLRMTYFPATSVVNLSSMLSFWEGRDRLKDGSWSMHSFRSQYRKSSDRITDAIMRMAQELFVPLSVSCWKMETTQLGNTLYLLYL